MKYPRPSFARHFRHLAGASADQPDSHLLEAVAVDRDPEAFRALVARHGPGVLAVCRRVLRNHHDAEDAFQATFLVLLRRAGQVGRPDRLPQWLNGVAAKVALKARERAARRAVREALAAGQAFPPPDRPVTVADLAAVIGHEVTRLPAKYREPFVLCHLAGRGQDEAAADLRVSRRTLQRRLDQARELLRERLSRRGVTLSAAVAAAAVAPGGASAVPLPLEADTVRLLAAPPEAARFLELAGGALRATAPARWQALAAAVLVAAAAGVGLATGLGPAARPPAPQAAAQPAADAPEADKLPDHAVLRLGSVRWRQGVWVGGGAAYSPDGKLIALQPQDGPVELCDAATGKVSAKLSNAAALGLLQFAPDGKRLVGVDFNTDDVQVWDHAAGLKLATIKPKVTGVLSLAVSPCGKWLAAGGNARLAVFELATGKELALPGLARGRYPAVAFSPDGKHLAAAAGLAADLWDVEGAKHLRRFEGHKLPVRAVALHPDGKHLVTTSSSGGLATGVEDVTLRLWDAGTGKDLARFRDTPPALEELAVLPGGRVVARGTNGVEAWDSATGKSLGVFAAEHRGGPFVSGPIPVSPDGTTLLGVGHRITFWDTATRAERPADERGHLSGVQSLQFTRDGGRLVSASADGTVRFWDAKTGRGLRRLDFPGYRPVASLSADGRTLVVSGTEGWARDRLLVLDAATGRELAAWRDTKVIANGAAVSPDGKTVAAVAGRQEFTLWDAATAKSLKTDTLPFAMPPYQFGFSPDSKAVAYGSAGAVAVSVPGGKAFPGDLAGAADGQGGWTGPVAWSADGKSLASCDHTGTVRVFDVAGGKERLSFRGPRESLYSLAFSPDGRLIAGGGSTPATVHLWDAATGRELAAWTPHRTRYVAVAFSPDGKTLASGGGDGVVLLWDVAACREGYKKK